MADDENRTCIPGDVVPAPEPVPDNITMQFNAPGKVPYLPAWEIALKVSFYILAMLIDLVGNSIVILIILLNRKMRTTTNVLILNLAASDLMVGIFCMWVHLVNQITPIWPLGPFLCKFSTFTQVMSVTASVLTLTVISVERFIAVMYPFKAHWSPTMTGIIIACTWAIAIGTASPHLVIRRQFRVRWKDRTAIWCGEDWPWVYKDASCKQWQYGKFVYYLVEGIVMYFLPIAIMFVAYSFVTVKLLIRKAPGSLISSTSSAQDKTKRKVTKMLIIVLLSFVICWTPQQIMLLADLFPNFSPPTYYNIIRYVGVYIAYFNSALNPILYGGFNENFRKGFVEAFKCILIQKRNKIGPVSEYGEKTTVKKAGQTGLRTNVTHISHQAAPAQSQGGFLKPPLPSIGSEDTTGEVARTLNNSPAASAAAIHPTENGTAEADMTSPEVQVAPTSVTSEEKQEPKESNT